MVLNFGLWQMCQINIRFDVSEERKEPWTIVIEQGEIERDDGEFAISLGRVVVPQTHGAQGGHFVRLRALLEPHALR